MARTCTLKGNTITLEGPELTVGARAPDVTLKKSLGEAVKLSELPARVKILSVVPSLDTPVCALQTKRFNKEATDMTNVDFYTVSCDLPTAQARFCGAEGINQERLHMLSDHQEVAFGKAFGTLIPDLRIECRAVFVLDQGGTIRYAEYVPEVADHPDYDAVLACAREVAG